MLIALAGLAALSPAAASAQARGEVAGQVTAAESGAALSGAQVRIAGTARQTVTDAGGRYRLTGVAPGSYTLNVSVIGRAAGSRPVTVAAGETATANFSLAASAIALEGVVVNAVTGQAQRRVEVGTNVGQINVAEIEKGAITQVSDVLQGRVAGVTLQGATGQAGSGQRIRIRGANSLSLSNDPLVYIDGVLSSTSRGGISLGGQDYSRLNDINPEDIQNMEILKGPAASAIYGTAAANGVILITTRRGRAGRPAWKGYAEAGRSSDVTDYPTNFVALQAFDATKDVYLISAASRGFLNTRNNFGATAPYALCPNYLAGLAPGTTGACTQDVLLSFNPFSDSRTTPFEDGSNSKLGMSVSGGSESLTYYISGDRQTEAGVLRPNDLERISLRSNLNAKVGNQANIAINASYVKSDLNRLSSDNSVFSPLINLGLGTAQYLPGMESDTIRSPGARLGSYFGYNFADQRRLTADQAIDRFIVGANGNYTPLSWLRVNGNAGLDFFARYDRQTTDPNYFPLSQTYLLGFRDAYRANNYQYTANASAVGTFDLTSNVVSTSTLGGSFQRSLFEQINCFGAGIPGGTRSCAATTSLFSVNESYTDARTLGAFARQEFAINDRLFVAGSIRADNNSGLVSGLIYYPSANASWVVSDEPFFPELGFLNQLRLRVAAGQSGQRPGFGQAETFFGSRVVQSGGVELPSLILTSTGNPNLKPERTTEYEGGFDLGLFGDRISADYTYFTRRSEDALIARNLPPSAGLTGSVFENLGSVRNWGQELGLSARILERDNFRFNARLTATTLRNEIEELGKGIAPISFNRGSQAHREGFPTGAFYALPIKYSDKDGNGKLTRTEVQVDSSKFLVVASDSARRAAGFTRDTLATSLVGPALPTNTQGLSGELTLFKNLTISTLFERRAGNKQLDYTTFFRCRTQGQTSASFSQCSALANPNASIEEQAAYIGAQFPEFGATPFGYIQDADFIKWRELSVRLGVPEALAGRFTGLRGASISLSGRNLKTWTDYTGLDPEINEGGGGANFSQNEFNTQPPVRVYQLRFDFNF
jgi:TonB-linked SusC/RagA family outer membrane protein